MKNLFKISAYGTSILFLYLFVELFFLNDSFVLDLGLEPSVTTQILSRRVAMFMFGISVLMFLARNLKASQARIIISAATGITLLGLSIMGTYELVRASVNSSMLIAIIIETIFWLAYLVIIYKDKSVLSKQKY